jgi:hypothetical protein
LKHEEVLREVEELLSPDFQCNEGPFGKLFHVLLKAIPIEEDFNCSQGCCPSSMLIDSTVSDDADPLSKEL